MAGAATEQELAWRRNTFGPSNAQILMHPFYTHTDADGAPLPGDNPFTQTEQHLNNRKSLRYHGAGDYAREAFQTLLPKGHEAERYNTVALGVLAGAPEMAPFIAMGEVPVQMIAQNRDNFDRGLDVTERKLRSVFSGKGW